MKKLTHHDVDITAHFQKECAVLYYHSNYYIVSNRKDAIANLIEYFSEFAIDIDEKLIATRRNVEYNASKNIHLCADYAYFSYENQEECDAECCIIDVAYEIN